jgi:hypothetical protein
MRLTKLIWNATTRKLSLSIAIDQFKEVQLLKQDWQAAAFHFARFLDSKFIAELKISTDKVLVYNKYCKLIVDNYWRCLKYGVKHIHHALPRLLTIVFGVGDAALEDDGLKELNVHVLHTLNTNQCIY